MTTLRFGSFEEASTSLVHNVFLDVYNDAGLRPLVFLLLVMIPLAWNMGEVLVSSLCYEDISKGLLLRWSLISLVVVEWLIQPFLYSDQLMFTLAFLFAGFLLAEFHQSQHAIESPFIE